MHTAAPHLFWDTLPYPKSYKSGQMQAQKSSISSENQQSRVQENLLLSKKNKPAAI